MSLHLGLHLIKQLQALLSVDLRLVRLFEVILRQTKELLLLWESLHIYNIHTFQTCF